MKIRNGFVSNSSTTNFSIYGALAYWSDFTEDSVLENIIKNNPDEVQKVIDQLKEYNYSKQAAYALEDAVSTSKFDQADPSVVSMIIKEAFGLEAYMGHDYCFIGRSWHKIGDDETGRQFKDDIENAIKKIGLKRKLRYESHLDETSY